MKLIECVPNFSEGRRRDVIDSIADVIRSTPGVTLLDVESNPDHNRSVISFVGEPGPVRQAALAASAKAIELIDLNKHEGEHPRMGAVDVVPFVPLSGATMDDCVTLAKDFGREFAERFHVPVFLYEEAASTPERRNLADVRAGEFEGLRDKIGRDPAKKPDFGPEKIHPTAGATAVGAREILIAYNVNLGTNDLAIAKKIAHQLRAKDGGLAYVKALGFELKERGIVQVSMNMTDYHKSQLFKAEELVELFAERYGVPVVGSEIVGLVPMDALVDSAEFYLKLENFSREQVLEKRLFTSSPSSLTDMSLSTFSEEVASKKATPGGGSVSAYVGSLAAGLVCMVGRITLSKKDVAQDRDQLQDAVRKGEELRQRFLGLVVEDAESFDGVMQAFKLPKDKPDARRKTIQEATAKAAEVPLRTLDSSVQVLRLAEEVAKYGVTNALSDVTTSVAAARAAMEGAASNVLINLDTLDDQHFVIKTHLRVSELRKEGLQLEQRIQELVASRSSKK
ncbi:glutamate formimidoyltransferase [Candidatus Bathyarchaeota archaeon]|nr:MAG: glutamate formimidoyltransferase [Candidatus Bathyarchaeota archaeon]